MTANYAVTPQARRIIVNDTVIDRRSTRAILPWALKVNEARARKNAPRSCRPALTRHRVIISGKCRALPGPSAARPAA